MQTVSRIDQIESQKNQF